MTPFEREVAGALMVALKPAQADYSAYDSQFLADLLAPRVAAAIEAVIESSEKSWQRQQDDALAALRGMVP